MEEDFEGDLRFTSVLFVRHYLKYLMDMFDCFQIEKIYPELLKRLDDS